MVASNDLMIPRSRLIIGFLGHGDMMGFGAIDVHLPPAALLGTLFMCVLLLAELAGMWGVLIVWRFSEGKGGIIGDCLDIIVHEGTVDMNQLISYSLHGSFHAIADQTAVFLGWQRGTLTSLTEKFADTIGLHGEAGLKVIATFVDSHEASTAEQDL